MNIEDLSVKLGLNVSANILQPAPGDLLVVKVDQLLSVKQREQIRETWIPKFSELGCKVILLDGGTDVMLIKQAVEEGESA